MGNTTFELPEHFPASSTVTPPFECRRGKSDHKSRVRIEDHFFADAFAGFDSDLAAGLSVLLDVEAGFDDSESFFAAAL